MCGPCKYTPFNILLFSLVFCITISGVPHTTYAMGPPFDQLNVRFQHNVLRFLLF